jgi:hypothetical protein
LIDKIAEHITRDNPESLSEQLMQLQLWWSRHYSRPLKDPILQDYTFEELYYEYRCIIEADKLREESLKKAMNQPDQQEEDEDKALDDALAWAEEEERKDREAMEAKLKEEEQKKWMEEQLQEQKEELGEEFGEDIYYEEE